MPPADNGKYPPPLESSLHRSGEQAAAAMDGAQRKASEPICRPSSPVHNPHATHSVGDAMAQEKVDPRPSSEDAGRNMGSEPSSLERVDPVELPASAELRDSAQPLTEVESFASRELEAPQGSSEDADQGVGGKQCEAEPTKPDSPKNVNPVITAAPIPVVPTSETNSAGNAEAASLVCESQDAVLSLAEDSSLHRSGESAASEMDEAQRKPSEPISKPAPPVGDPHGTALVDDALASVKVGPRPSSEDARCNVVSEPSSLQQTDPVELPASAELCDSARPLAEVESLALREPDVAPGSSEDADQGVAVKPCGTEFMQPDLPKEANPVIAGAPLLEVPTTARSSPGDAELPSPANEPQDAALSGAEEASVAVGHLRPVDGGVNTHPCKMQSIDKHDSVRNDVLDATRAAHESSKTGSVVEAKGADAVGETKGGNHGQGAKPSDVALMEKVDGELVLVMASSVEVLVAAPKDRTCVEANGIAQNLPETVLLDEADQSALLVQPASAEDRASFKCFVEESMERNDSPSNGEASIAEASLVAEPAIAMRLPDRVGPTSVSQEQPDAPVKDEAELSVVVDQPIDCDCRGKTKPDEVQEPDNLSKSSEAKAVAGVAELAPAEPLFESSLAEPFTILREAANVQPLPETAPSALAAPSLPRVPQFKRLPVEYKLVANLRESAGQSQQSGASADGSASSGSLKAAPDTPSKAADEAVSGLAQDPASPAHPGFMGAPIALRPLLLGASLAGLPPGPPRGPPPALPPAASAKYVATGACPKAGRPSAPPNDLKPKLPPAGQAAVELHELLHGAFPSPPPPKMPQPGLERALEPVPRMKGPPMVQRKGCVIEEVGINGHPQEVPGLGPNALVVQTIGSVTDSIPPLPLGPSSKAEPIPQMKQPPVVPPCVHGSEEIGTGSGHQEASSLATSLTGSGSPPSLGQLPKPPERFGASPALSLETRPALSGGPAPTSVPFSPLPVLAATEPQMPFPVSANATLPPVSLTGFGVVQTGFSTLPLQAGPVAQLPQIHDQLQARLGLARDELLPFGSGSGGLVPRPLIAEVLPPIWMPPDTQGTTLTAVSAGQMSSVQDLHCGSPRVLQNTCNLLAGSTLQLPTVSPLCHVASVGPLSAGIATSPLGLVTLGPPMAPVNKSPEYWESHTSPTGDPYYYCKRTGESRWVLPNGPMDVVLPRSGAPVLPQSVATKTGGAGDMKAKLGEPETWETIGKTGWLRVETENGYQYFYHKKTKRTSWTCPDGISKEVAELDGALGAGTDCVRGDPGAVEAPGGVDAGGDDGDGDNVLVGGSQLSRMEKAEARQRHVEAEQRAAKERDRLRNFRQMLIEKGVKAFDKYEKWMPKLIHDARFTAVPGQAARKTLFEALAKQLDSERRKQTAAAKRGGREAFREVLAKADKLGLLRDRTASLVQRMLERHFGEDDAWDAVPERDRERLIAEAVEESTARWAKNREGACRDFRELISGLLHGREQAPPPWHVMRKRLQDDPRWAAMESASECERLYEQVVRELDASRRQWLRRQRQDDEEMDAARKKRRLTAAEESLHNLFAERIKAPYLMEWTDAMSALGENRQLRDCELHPYEQERVWIEYKRSANDARRQAFLLRLTNTSADLVGPEMSFEQVLERSTDGASAKAFAGVPEDVLRSAWEEWREKAHVMAVEVCRQWLRSCEHFRDAEGVCVGTSEFEGLLAKLRDDVRFRRLGHQPQEQRRLVVERIEELRHFRGRGRSGAEEEEVV